MTIEQPPPKDAHGPQWLKVQLRELKTSGAYEPAELLTIASKRVLFWDKFKTYM